SVAAGFPVASGRSGAALVGFGVASRPFPFGPFPVPPLPALEPPLPPWPSPVVPGLPGSPSGVGRSTAPIVWIAPALRAIARATASPIASAARGGTRPTSACSTYTLRPRPVSRAQALQPGPVAAQAGFERRGRDRVTRVKDGGGGLAHDPFVGREGGRCRALVAALRGRLRLTKSLAQPTELCDRAGRWIRRERHGLDPESHLVECAARAGGGCCPAGHRPHEQRGRDQGDGRTPPTPDPRLSCWTPGG